MIFHRQFKTIPIIGLCLLLLGFQVDSANSDENNPHSGINCKNCHAINKGINVQRENCLTCHKTRQKDGYLDVLNFHQDNNRQCTDCHTFHDTKYIHIDSVKFQFDFDSENSNATCFACHLNGTLGSLSDGHRKAGKLYHSDINKEYALTPSQTCMVCHKSGNNKFELVFDVTDMPLINNHSSHPYEIELVRGEGNSTNRIKFEIAPDINLFDNSIECQTCHNLSTENANLLVRAENSSDFCSGCHEHNENNIDFVSIP